MNREDLIYELSNMKNAARIYRQQLCDLALNDKTIIPILINLSFEYDNKLSIKAAWILEFFVKDSVHHIIPYINQITSKIANLKFDSSKRSFANICEILANNYQKKGIFYQILAKKHKKEIISCCFDWMLSNEKVAVEAYSMNVLYIFGKEEKWIHNELSYILKENMHRKSCGYKARGKKILAAISAN